MGAEKKPAIVLAHGLVHPLGAAADVLLKRSYFRGVPEYLRKKGFRVLDPKVSNMGHVHERAELLRERIQAWDEREPGERVFLISHSMGGLDARHMISNLAGDELVETLVTIGTPHLGCCVADLIVDEAPLIPDLYTKLERLGLSLKALECLTRRYAREFNKVCPDSERVRYFSLSGQKGDEAKDYSPILRPTLRFVAQREGPNDGMVSVSSSKWGKHLGVLPFDHIEQIDRVPVYDRVLAVLFGSQTVASAAPFVPVETAGAAAVAPAGTTTFAG